MVTAGKEGLAYCRTDRVFADAAYVVLTRDSRARTGEFLYDEDVLREAGVTDFEQYSYIPGIVVWYNKGPNVLVVNWFKFLAEAYSST